MEIEIQKRDIQIMKFAFACRAVSYDQVIRRHFPKTASAVARKRIRKLCDAGYLKSSALELGKTAIRAIQPLASMWPIICETWQFEVDTPHFKSESIFHDVCVAEIFLRLEKLKCYRSFFTENLLQSSLALAEDPRFRDLAKIQADGALTIQDTNGELRVYGIEMELSKKSPERYHQKLVDYYLARGIDGVIYIAPKQETIAAIARIDQEVRSQRDSILYFGIEDRVLSEADKITFQGIKGQLLELV